LSFLFPFLTIFLLSGTKLDHLKHTRCIEFVGASEKNQTSDPVITNIVLWHHYVQNGTKTSTFG